MADNIAALKTELRTKLRFRRDQYVRNLPDLVHAIAFRAPPSPLRTVLTAARCVGGYVATSSEAPVEALLALACDAGIGAALPFFAARDGGMAFAAWKPGDAIVPGPWRVGQPADCQSLVAPDVLLCPLLGFDRAGGRIGQGGGHYDRYCAVSPDTLRIGIGWSVQEVDAIPLERHDLTLDAILTEQEWIVTGDRL